MGTDVAASGMNPRDRIGAPHMGALDRGGGGVDESMRTHARMFGLLGTVLFLVATILAACAAPTVAVNSSTNGGGPNVFRTPNPNDTSPTPTFPPFTVGAWPSNYSPANNEHMTIYVLCKQQPTNQAGPGTPVPNTTVDIFVGAPVNLDINDGKGEKPTTDATGLATGQFDLNDPKSGLPVTVSITVTLGNKTYHAETFFTPNPTQAPTATPGPSKTPTGTATPTATP